MKITCEIDELDLEDGESLDEAIRTRILDEVIKRTTQKFSTEFLKKIEMEASTNLAKKVDDLSTDLLNRFMNKEVIVSDGWGDIQSKHESVTELLKSKFDDFLTQKVDKRGCVSKYCGDTYTRLDYLLDTRVDAACDKLSKLVANEVDEKIKKKLAATHKQTIEQITRKLGLDV